MSEYCLIFKSMMYLNVSYIYIYIEVYIALLHSILFQLQSSTVLHCQHGANVSASGMDGEQPIHWAAGVGHAVGLLRMFRCLELTVRCDKISAVKDGETIHG